MEKSYRYLVVFNLSNSTNEATFYEILRSIDPEPENVVADAVYGVKNASSASVIFQRLSATLSPGDELIVLELTKRNCEIQSPNFKHWFDY